jgi:hypothetical protein
MEFHYANKYRKAKKTHGKDELFWLEGLPA